MISRVLTREEAAALATAVCKGKKENHPFPRSGQYVTIHAAPEIGLTWEGGEAVTREFGEYLKELVENDRWGELERYVISTS